MDNDWTRYSRFIADKAALAMRRKNITQTALAAKMGRTQQYVSHLLNGRENLTLETVSFLGKALETDLLKDLATGYGGATRSPQFLREESYPACSSVTSSLPILRSAAPISKRFNTGDRPFLITCEDSGLYLCKAATFGSNAVNLARELTGTSFAGIWGLSSLPLVLIKVLPKHLDGAELHNNYAITCLGRKWLEDAVEIKDSLPGPAVCASENFISLLKIALFDIWMANEDRLNNNLNLLCSNKTCNIVAIDHAGIFNSSFSAPLLRLSYTDSVLYSNLFTEMVGRFPIDGSTIVSLLAFYKEKTEACRSHIPKIWEMFPEDWNIEKAGFENLMDFIFSKTWIDSAFDNFVRLLHQPES